MKKVAVRDKMTKLFFTGVEGGYAQWSPVPRFFDTEAELKAFFWAEWVEPIMFNRPERVMKLKSNQLYEIVVFEVTEVETKEPFRLED